MLQDAGMDDYVDDDDDIVNDQPVELLVPLEDSHVLRQDNVLVCVQDALTVGDMDDEDGNG